MAFPKWVRRLMFGRDNATCQDCGKRWDDGWMLQAAHNENGTSPPTSNDIDAGKMKCIACHLKQHSHLYNLAQKRKDKKEMARHKSAVEALKQTDHMRRGWK